MNDIWYFLVVSEVATNLEKLTFVIQDGFDGRLRQTHRRRIYIQIVVQRQHKTKFTFAEVEIEGFEICFRQVVELCLYPVTGQSKRELDNRTG